ncbi:hypothetical protein NDI98_17555 [Vibrio cholerae]|nr:hypothetical protein [Vibrio cholerae]MEB5517213.1 hypothetical protein [Vibrio cholerae]
MALTKGQPMAVQICSRQICHSLVAYLQLQVVWVYIIFAHFALEPLLIHTLFMCFCLTKSHQLFQCCLL